MRGMAKGLTKDTGFKFILVVQCSPLKFVLKSINQSPLVRLTLSRLLNLWELFLQLSTGCSAIEEVRCILQNVVLKIVSAANAIEPCSLSQSHVA